MKDIMAYIANTPDDVRVMLETIGLDSLDQLFDMIPPEYRLGRPLAIPEALGGGQTTLLSRGVRYASVAINQKPSTVASVAVQCEDGEKAKSLLDSVTRGIESLKAKIAGTPQADDLTKKIDALKPTLVGDIMILDVDPIAIQMLGAGVFSSRGAVAQ